MGRLPPPVLERQVYDGRPSRGSGEPLSGMGGGSALLQFAKRIKEQNPSWQRGITKALTMIAAGEFAMVAAPPLRFGSIAYCATIPRPN